MARWLLVLTLFAASCTETKVRYALMEMDGHVTGDTAIERQIMPYRDSLSARMGERLVTSTAPLGRGKPDSPLGSLIADVILEEARREQPEGVPSIDLCLLNIGGLRIDLPQGDITVNHAFELMPFENGISLLRLSPKSMNAMLTYIIGVGGQPVSGLTLHVQDSAVSRCMINGEPLEDRSYWIATSDYLADGGDRMTFFGDHEERIDLGLKIRDTIIRNFRRKGMDGETIAPPPDQRITIAP